jgi:hypothetical protein
MMGRTSESFWVSCAGSVAMALYLGVVAGCHSGAKGGAANVRPGIDLQSDAPWPSSYAEDALWRRAASGDDFEQARLAQRDGASGLCDVLELGGSLGSTALAALRYAPDRRETLGRLCEFAANASPASRARLIDAMYEAAMNGPRGEPASDPAQRAACLTKLQQLSERQGQSPEERDRVAALREALQPGVPGSRAR